jgi:hypothetical protein
VPNAVVHGEPHLALDDDRLDRERMRMRLKHRARRPPAFHDFVEALRPRVGREFLERP